MKTTPLTTESVPDPGSPAVAAFLHFNGAHLVMAESIPYGGAVFDGPEFQ